MLMLMLLLFAKGMAMDKIKQLIYIQGSNFDQRAVPINRFLYSTTVQNFTHLSYSFRVTTPIIGAGRWHGPIK